MPAHKAGCNLDGRKALWFQRATETCLGSLRMPVITFAADGETAGLNKSQVVL